MFVSKSKSVLVSGTALAALLFAMTGPAQAQTTQPEAETNEPATTPTTAETPPTNADVSSGPPS